MRSLGQFARGEELQEMLQEVDSDGEFQIRSVYFKFICIVLCLFFGAGDGNVSFEEFVGILVNIGATQECTDEAQEEQELRDAFRVFDKHNRGYICASDLRAVLQCLGEDLSEEESKYFFRR